MKLKKRYLINKEAKVGDTLVCPSCGTKFIKNNYQQAFCKSKPKTQCKDKYWNTVIPHKKNNTTRISPANAAWMEQRRHCERWSPEDEEHPFSSEALSQD